MRRLVGGLAMLFLGGIAATVFLLIASARRGAPAPLPHREDDDGIQPMDHWLDQLPWLTK
jgi:hypothetical protein